jgi:hypothetical protein
VNDQESNLGDVTKLCRLALLMRRLLGISKTPEHLAELEILIAEKIPDFAEKLMNLAINDAKEEVSQLHSILSWVDYGMPVYDITHSLMAALLLTDPSDVDAADVKLPFGTFVVRLPQPFWTMMENTEHAAPVALAVISRLSVTRLEMLDGVPRIVGTGPQIVTRMTTKGGNQIWERRPDLPESGNIGGWIDHVVVPVNPGPVREPTSGDKHLLQAFRRLIVNLCLYLAEHGRGEKLGRPSSSKKPRDGEVVEPQPDIWVIGREVKLDRELVTSAKAWTETRAGRTEGWRLRSRFTVTGHWRNQPHGEGRLLRKRKWIAPYWKGEGPTFTHVYKP